MVQHTSTNRDMFLMVCFLYTLFVSVVSRPEFSMSRVSSRHKVSIAYRGESAYTFHYILLRTSCVYNLHK